MTWGDTVRRIRSAWTYEETRTAAACSAAQWPAAWLAWWVLTRSVQDDYGIGYGGAFGLICLLLFAPLYLPVLGLLHTLLHIAPAAVLARTAPARRLPGPAWARHLAAVALLGAVWAVPVAWAAGSGFWSTALSCALLGAAPALAAGYARRGRRTESDLPGWGCWGVWFRAGAGGFLLFAGAFGGLALAARSGLVPEYEPPVLSAAQVTGVWRSGDGAVLRLDADGGAELVRLPMKVTDRTDRSIPVCAGTGTWSLRRDGPYGEERDGVLVRPGASGSCDQDTYWTIGGTEDAPELFVLLGDPDAGDLLVLTRDQGSRAARLP
ncbi:hypothetical protein AB0E75_21240 [Streptomyces griseoviridis]|uniref:Uncharacterized protein n=1 Tax=Streptomyces griseoviridis TaxID=45398 RepID=A0A918LBJ6_STRGD|nr:hypothetical protein [Streptomyces niveoruber]GGS29188.1 hypothetical protein GCM10010238_17500 [Streptomyces niveoruber]